MFKEIKLINKETNTKLLKRTYQDYLTGLHLTYSLLNRENNT